MGPLDELCGNSAPAALALQKPIKWLSITFLVFLQLISIEWNNKWKLWAVLKLGEGVITMSVLGIKVHLQSPWLFRIQIITYQLLKTYT